MAAKLKRGRYSQEYPVQTVQPKSAKSLSVPPAKNAERWLTKVKMYVPSWLVGGMFHGKRKG